MPYCSFLLFIDKEFEPNLPNPRKNEADKHPFYTSIFSLTMFLFRKPAPVAPETLTGCKTTSVSRLADKAATAHIVVQTALAMTALDVDSLATQASQMCISSRQDRADVREAALAQRKQERADRLAAKSADREAAAVLRAQEREARLAEKKADREIAAALRAEARKN